MLHVWVQHWGFLERRANASPVPIFIGEFGTCGTSPQCVTDPTPGSQGLWFSFLVRYLRTHPEVSWSFWALNGTNHVGSDCPQYILDTTWRRARLPALVDTLRDLEIAPPPAP
jgi:hypothetical protein